MLLLRIQTIFLQPGRNVLVVAYDRGADLAFGNKKTGRHTGSRAHVAFSPNGKLFPTVAGWTAVIRDSTPA